MLILTIVMNNSTLSTIDLHRRAHELISIGAQSEDFARLTEALGGHSENKKNRMRSLQLYSEPRTN